MRINKTKILFIENIMNKFVSENVMIVGVSDTSRVHFSCTSSRVLLTDYTTRHYIYRKNNIDQIQKDTNIINAWYNNTGHMDVMSPGTTIRIFKFDW